MELPLLHFCRELVVMFLSRLHLKMILLQGDAGYPDEPEIDAKSEYLYVDSAGIRGWYSGAMVGQSKSPGQWDPTVSHYRERNNNPEECLNFSQLLPDFILLKFIFSS